ncbi:hypothetical protein [Halpernia sp.]|uniref:hypothetical protein n=1 Tax=Halpernia sp. TaxID=2782209 RepID=UPI003A8D61E4
MTLSINSCTDNDALAYDGDSLLLFSAPQSSADVFVFSGTGSTDYKIPFGVAKQVETDSDVTLVVDAANSTAKEGVDFTIPNKTVTLKAGTATGVFPIKFLEGGATQSGKTVAFKLTSNSLKNAGFNQNFAINVSLTCPVATFLGDFTNTESFFFNPGSVVSIVAAPNAQNQLIVKDYFPNDLVLNYDPNTFVVTIPTQSCGFSYAAYGNVSVRKPSDATLVSSFNPCTRVLTLYMNYFVSAGSFGDGQDIFEGI